MACDASLPGHTVQLPHECANEEERFQHEVGGEMMSFCPHHYALYCAIVTKSFGIVIGDMFDNIHTLVVDLDQRVQALHQFAFGNQR